jgi:hypothetical protein
MLRFWVGTNFEGKRLQTLEVGEYVPRTDETLKEDPVEGEVTLEFVWSFDASESLFAEILRRVCWKPIRLGNWGILVSSIACCVLQSPWLISL